MSNEETIKIMLGVYDFDKLLAYKTLCNEYYDCQIEKLSKSGALDAAENILGTIKEKEDMNRIVMEVFGNMHEKILTESRLRPAKISTELRQ